MIRVTGSALEIAQLLKELDNLPDLNIEVRVEAERCKQDIYLELLDGLNWDAPKEEWKEYTASDIAEKFGYTKKSVVAGALMKMHQERNINVREQYRKPNL